MVRTKICNAFLQNTSISCYRRLYVLAGSLSAMRDAKIHLLSFFGDFLEVVSYVRIKLALARGRFLVRIRMAVRAKNFVRIGA